MSNKRHAGTHHNAHGALDYTYFERTIFGLKSIAKSRWAKPDGRDMPHGPAQRNLPRHYE